MTLLSFNSWKLFLGLSGHVQLLVLVLFARGRLIKTPQVTQALHLYPFIIGFTLIEKSFVDDGASSGRLFAFLKLVLLLQAWYSTVDLS